MPWSALVPIQQHLFLQLKTGQHRKHHVLKDILSSSKEQMKKQYFAVSQISVCDYTSHSELYITMEPPVLQLRDRVE